MRCGGGQIHHPLSSLPRPAAVAAPSSHLPPPCGAFLSPSPHAAALSLGRRSAREREELSGAWLGGGARLLGGGGPCGAAAVRSAAPSPLTGGGSPLPHRRRLPCEARLRRRRLPFSLPHCAAPSSLPPPRGRPFTRPQIWPRTAAACSGQRRWEVGGGLRHGGLRWGGARERRRRWRGGTSGGGGGVEARAAAVPFFN